MKLRTISFHSALTIEVPESWREDSVTIFSNGGTGEESASVVLRRESVDPRTSLATYTDLQIAELAKSLPSFSLINRKTMTLNGIQAAQLGYAWVVQGLSYSQTQTMLRDSPVTMICIITSSSLRHAKELEGDFAQIVQSAQVVSSSPTGTT